jgi:hypothetical protein
MFETSEEYKQRVGGVDVGVSLDFRSRGEVIRDFVIALLLAIGFLVVSAWLGWPDVLSVVIAWSVFGAYCVAAYFLRVRPNHDEMGAGGGIIDNPLRVSDGMNRGLVRLAVILAIGRLVSTGLVDGIRLLSRGKLPHENFMEKIE